MFFAVNVCFPSELSLIRIRRSALWNNSTQNHKERFKEFEWKWKSLFFKLEGVYYEITQLKMIRIKELSKNLKANSFLIQLEGVHYEITRLKMIGFEEARLRRRGEGRSDYEGGLQLKITRLKMIRRGSRLIELDWG